MKQNSIIGRDELIKNLLGPIKTQIAKFNNKVHVIQVSWDVKGTPCGDQVMFLVCHEDESEVQSFFDAIRDYTKRMEGHYTILIDDYDPSKHYIPTVVMLLDGEGTGNIINITSNNSKFTIGYLTGQGRKIDDDEGILYGLLPKVVSHLLHGKVDNEVLSMAYNNLQQDLRKVTVDNQEVGSK